MKESQPFPLLMLFWSTCKLKKEICIQDTVTNNSTLRKEQGQKHFCYFCPHCVYKPFSTLCTVLITQLTIFLKNEQR